MADVWDHSPLLESQLLIHLAIADVVNDAHDNEFWMTRPELAAKTRCALSTVARTLAELIALGWLEVLEEGGGRGNPTRYRFHSPGENDIHNRGYRDKKPSDAEQETVRRGAPIGITQVNAKNTSAASASVVDNAGHPECPTCHGRGEHYNAVGGFDVPCPCTYDPEWKPPGPPTRPPAGFGMPADRAPV